MRSLLPITMVTLLVSGCFVPGPRPKTDLALAALAAAGSVWMFHEARVEASACHAPADCWDDGAVIVGSGMAFTAWVYVIAAVVGLSQINDARIARLRSARAH